MTACHKKKTLYAAQTRRVGNKSLEEDKQSFLKLKEKNFVREKEKHGLAASYYRRVSTLPIAAVKLTTS